MAKKTDRPSVPETRRPAPPPEPSSHQRAARLVRECRDLLLSIGEEQGLSRRELSGLDSLVLRIPLHFDSRAFDRIQEEEVLELTAGISQQVLEFTRGQTAFKLGHVYCFQCNSPDCVHSRPADRTETFVGYLPMGKPAFKSFTNLCIERRESRIDQVFAEPPEVIALVLWSYELDECLMPSLHRQKVVYTVLGQVVAGLVPADLRQSRQPTDRVCLTFQVLETQVGAKGRRLRLNVLGLSPDEIAAAVSQASPRDPAERLRRLIIDTRRRLDAIGFHITQSQKRGEPVELMRQVEPILVKLKTDVEHIFRPQRQRTQHAQERHRTGDRPTSNALNDARQAPDEKLLLDTTRDTVVVIGKKGRAHVFSKEGRHVTSMQIKPGELDRKTGLKRWLPMNREAIEAFRKALEAEESNS